MASFNTEMSIEDILKIMNNSGGSVTTMHAGPCFLQYKLHQELMIEQKKNQEALIALQQKFQKENLSKTRSLVIATWALVFVTIMICFLPK